MSYLNIRTEFSFRQTFAPIKNAADLAKEFGQGFAGIADTNNTFGHIQWEKHCKATGITSILGVTLPVVGDLDSKDRRFAYNEMTFIALDSAGLSELYRLVDIAHQQFYYMPRISYAQVNLTSNCILVLGGLAPAIDKIKHPNFHLSLAPNTPRAMRDIRSIPALACADNWFLSPGDNTVYQPLTNDLYRNSKTSCMHIPTYDEWLMEFPGREGALELMIKTGKSINVQVPHADMVKFRPMAGDPTIKQWCKAGAKAKGINIKKGKYNRRYKREMKLIKSKGYVDYFMVVADVIKYAKERMLVGPSRGSSAGSLVCYLMGITEVDPLKYGLIFERFIDANRLDLPDIDVDFQDNKRHMVITYLQKRYGKECVAQIGNISRFKPKSAISQFARSLCVPIIDTEEFKDAIMERSSGDARSAFCIQDTFTGTDVGKEFLKNYPAMELVSRIEGHASHTGVHAAGVIVCNKPITNYVGINSRDNKSIGMLDKKDAEHINLLKIDALGLRTLAIIAGVCDSIGKPYEWVYEIPLDDAKAYDIFNKQRLNGIFQFEGEAVRLLSKQMPIESIDDVSAMGALCRPGPLHCGGATAFINRRIGTDKVIYLDDHKSIIDATKGTYGVIIYQEQVMVIGREYGGLSWEDVSNLRKAMSKSLGDEFFAGYKEKFLAGALAKGRKKKVATKVWDSMCTFGSWSFNLSHAVSYGLISYTTAYLKAHYPVEFTLASLNHARTDKTAVRLLREMVAQDGIKYKAFSPAAQRKWSIQDGVLVAGLTSIAGIGPANASTIIRCNNEGLPIPAGIKRKIDTGDSPFKYLYPAKQLYGQYYKKPKKYIGWCGLSKISKIKAILEPGMYAFIGCLIQKNLRDVNEVGSVANRGGEYIDPPTSFLNMMFEDDTDSIFATVWRFDYEELGKDVSEAGKVDKDWYLVVGELQGNWRKISVKHIERITI